MMRRTGLAIIIAISLAAGLAPSRAEEETGVPPPVRHQIENLLNAKVSSLLSERNADGNFYKRGTWSRQLHRIDESTYKVGFLLDTAEPDALETRRSVLTVQQAPPSGEWKITREELQDTWRGLTRAATGGEEFCDFDRLIFQKEGMTLDATKGSLYKEYRQGKLESIVIAGGGLAFDYIPPMQKDRQPYLLLS